MLQIYSISAKSEEYSLNLCHYLRIIRKRMGNIKIIRGVFDTKLELERANVMAASRLLLTTTGMRRWTSIGTTSSTLKPRSMAKWRVTR